MRYESQRSMEDQVFYFNRVMNALGHSTFNFKGWFEANRTTEEKGKEFGQDRVIMVRFSQGTVDVDMTDHYVVVVDGKPGQGYRVPYDRKYRKDIHELIYGVMDLVSCSCPSCDGPTKQMINKSEEMVWDDISPD